LEFRDCGFVVRLKSVAGEYGSLRCKFQGCSDYNYGHETASVTGSKEITPSQVFLNVLFFVPASLSS